MRCHVCLVWKLLIDITINANPPIDSCKTRTVVMPLELKVDDYCVSGALISLLHRRWESVGQSMNKGFRLPLHVGMIVLSEVHNIHVIQYCAV